MPAVKQYDRRILVLFQKPGTGVSLARRTDRYHRNINERFQHPIAAHLSIDHHGKIGPAPIKWT